MTTPRPQDRSGRRLRAVSGTVPDPVPDPGPARPAGAEPAGRQVRLVKASGIKLRPTFWMWDGRMPLGGITIGPGREGIGKSLFCSWLAARVTLGELPGEHYGTPKSVIYAATEDSWERTIAGRLHVAGADMDRVYRVEVDHIGSTVPLSLPRDCDAMAAEITRHDVALMVLDPLISAVDSRINVNGEELRGALEPLAKLADDTSCAIFGLAHFNKGSQSDVLSRITGSRAFAAVARAAIAFARDHNADDGSCVISQAKNNLGRLDVPSLRYLVRSVELDTDEGPSQWGQLQITGETDTHVEDLLNDSAPAEDRQEKRAARTWLRDCLTGAGGSATAKDVFTEAEAAGFSRDQIKRAKKDLEVEARKDGMRGGWMWHLPAEGSEGGEAQ